jgi:SAM domain (Sterile alpha motif)
MFLREKASQTIVAAQVKLPRFLRRRAITDLSVYALCCRGPKLGHDRTFVVAMQQIADWLKKLDMSDYAETFAANDIDIAVLPGLTDQHRKEPGDSLVRRLKMLHAIGDLGIASVAATATSIPRSNRANSAGSSRAPAADGHVLRPGRRDGKMVAS